MTAELAVVVATAAPHHPGGRAGVAVDFAELVGLGPVLTDLPLLPRVDSDAPAARYALRRRDISRDDSQAALRLYEAIQTARTVEIKCERKMPANGLTVDERPRTRPDGYERIASAAYSAHVGTTQTIGGGGQVGTATLVRWAGCLFWVREGIAGDHFLVHSNARWGMKTGRGLPWQLYQVLNVCTDKPEHLPQIMALVEFLDPLHRPVEVNARWTPTTARKILSI